MSKYLLNLQASGTSAEKDAQLEHDAQQAALSLQSQILATQQEVKNAERSLQALKSKYPLDAKAIVEAHNTLNDWNSGLAILTALNTELFS